MMAHTDRESDTAPSAKPPDPARRGTIALAVVMLVALAVRLWALGSIPTVFFHDECDNTINAIGILEGRGPGLFELDWKPQPALAVHFIAGSLKALGPRLAAVRLPTAVLTVLALIPFYLLASRVAGTFAAVLAALLFACNVGYLNFSRSGWENAQICLWTLLAMEAVIRAEERRRLAWWVVAGVAAAIGAYTYFAGRAIIIFLGAYAAIGLLSRARRRTVAAGLLVMVLAFGAVVAPLVPTVVRNWTLFNARTRTVLITQSLPPDAGTREVLVAMGLGALHGIQTYTRGAINNQPRYYPVGWPLLDRVENALLFIGVALSLWKWRQTGLWWLAFLVPFAATQMLTMGAPDLARGIGMLPIVYLFIAVGISALERAGRTSKLVVQALLVLSVAVSAGTNIRAYFDWAASEALERPLHPAVPRDMFGQWWDEQVTSIRSGRGFLNVGTWRATHGLERPDTPPDGDRRRSDAESAPPVTPKAQRTPVGEIYRGSTTPTPYEIDLGTVTTTDGVIEVEVFAVPGSDAVYDYVDIVASDGTRVRAEAEDWRYTTGDTPAKDHRIDNHWWLQDFEPFSGRKGLVALKSEVPPPLLTRLRVAPGTYGVRLGSFTGDPSNGVFALQVSVATVAPAGSEVPAAK